MIGRILGHYRITEKIGEGGMGVVYRAHDTLLNRDVAIKVLPDNFVSDPERKARFSREARILATLSNPNIASIYGLEEAEGKPHLVLEMVEGQTLADRIKKGPIPLEETLAICRQVAEGLDAAHEKGIVHRDLKPANIKITPDGKVKILDFGLARAFQEEPEAIDVSQSPTITDRMTRPGVILGTAAYASPEQARGKVVDKRTDIWAFGCVLFEMLTGKPVFEGETIAEILGGIMKVEPDWKSLPAETPLSVQKIVRRCLQKDCYRRFQHMGDVRIEIDDAIAPAFPDLPAAAAKRTSPWHPLLPWAVAGVLGIIAAVAIFSFYSRKATAESPLMRFEIFLPAGATNIEVSPDGRHIAYIAPSDGKGQIWIRQIDTGTDYVLNEKNDATGLSWSPDSRFIGFFAGGKLKKVDVSGHSAQALADSKAGSATWSKNGLILFNKDGAIIRVSATGGQESPVTQLDTAHNELGHSAPQFLPDDDHFLYRAMNGGTLRSFLYIASLSSSKKTLLMEIERGTPVRYVAPGYLLFTRGGALVAQRLDIDRSLLVGEPVTIAENAYVSAASENGILVYRRVAADPESSTLLTWFDRGGRQVGEAGMPSAYLSLDLSRDDQRVALDRTVAGNRDIWVYELARNVPIRITVDPTVELIPAISPGADRVAYGSSAGESNSISSRIFQKPVNGMGAAELLFAGDPGEIVFPKQWSADGRYIIFSRIMARNGIISADLWLLPTFGDRKAVPLLESDFRKEQPCLSDDSHWLAYTTNESGVSQIVVQPFPNPGNEKWQVTAAGGYGPQWRKDGRELFYIDLKGNLMAMPIQPGVVGPQMGQPVLLFKTALGGPGNTTFNRYGVTADGQRFLMIVPVTPAGAQEKFTPVTIVVNWTATLLTK